MRIHVHCRGFAPTEALRLHGERRLLYALSRFGRQVRAVRVRLDDLNGTRGGIDKRCQIVAQLVPWRDVRVEQLDGDLYAAIDRAADRAHQAVAREIERLRETRLVRATRETKQRTQ
jgi:ribosome-associated translation inhibitor RaiA